MSLITQCRDSTQMSVVVAVVFAVGAVVIVGRRDGLVSERRLTKCFIVIVVVVTIVVVDVAICEMPIDGHRDRVCFVGILQKQK